MKNMTNLINIQSSKFRLKFLGFLLVMGTVFLQSHFVFAQNKKPNIIFILTDDQRAEAMGYAGNKIIKTPEMDKLASQGIYFKNAFVQANRIF